MFKDIAAITHIPDRLGAKSMHIHTNLYCDTLRVQSHAQSDTHHSGYIAYCLKRVI